MKPSIEYIAVPDGRSFAQIAFAAPDFDCPYHAHPEIEILRIVQGYGRYLVGRTPGSFAPGDLFLLGPDLPHLFRNEPVREGDGLARSEYVQFLPRCLGDSFFGLPEMSKVGRLLRLAEGGLHFSQASSSKLAPAFEELFRARDGLAIAALVRILEAMVLHAPRPVGTPCPVTHSRAQRIGSALEALHLRFREEISRDQLASLCRMTPQSFSRAFRSCVGTTLQEYLVQLRLEECRRLLIESDASIVEAAFSSGFRNLSNFNRHFRLRFGISPRAWRREALAR